MTRARIEIGREVLAVSEAEGGIELKGRVRLLPGRPVEVVTRAQDKSPVIRRAVVDSWRIVELGSAGPLYLGTCRWE